MTAALSPERLSALIGAIYDCALAPERWPQTIDGLRLELNFFNASLSLATLPAGTLLLNVTAGIEQKWLDMMPAYGAEVIDQWGGAEKILSLPMNEPAVHSQVLEKGVKNNERYYREWVEPQGLIDQLAIGLARDSTMIGSLAMGRHESAGPIGTWEVDTARLFIPHLQRAVAISKLLDLKSVAAATFSAALDTLAAAVVLTGVDLQIVHANQAAQAMLASGDLIRNHRGKLDLIERPQAAALAVAVAKAAENEAAIGRHGFGIPVRRGGTEPCVLHVLPLKGGAVRAGLEPSAVAAIFVTPATSPPPAPAEALAALFDLTPMEARVLSLIAEGETPNSIAQLLAIAPSTVKTHLLHLFSKTGTRRQTDLFDLATSLRSWGRTI